MASTALSHLHSFSSSLALRRRLSILSPFIPRSQPSVFMMSLGGTEKNVGSSEAKSSFSHNADASSLYVDGTINSYRHMEDKSTRSMGMEGYEELGEIAPQKRAAMIHDFCLGIPFGGLIFCGGLFGFVFSRNLIALKTNALIGGALLALSTMSLKVWKSGKSSLPFILGQIALSTTLLWKHFHTYMLTKKGFPALFYVLISASMLGFYSYVILAGGNPPPKKLKSAKYSTSYGE